MSRVAILTGASRGVGAFLARGLLDRDTRLITLSRSDNPELVDIARQRGADLIQLRVDLSDLTATEAAAERMASLMPRDRARYLLINNAASVAPIATAGRLKSGASIAQALNLNLAAAMVLSAHFLEVVQGVDADRRILNISSGAGRNPVEGWSVYCATKAALDMYTRVLKLEQGAGGVRVAALSPGVIDTDMQAAIRDTDPADFPPVASFRELKVAGNLSAPDTVAGRILAYLDHDGFGETEIYDIRRFN